MNRVGGRPVICVLTQDGGGQGEKFYFLLRFVSTEAQTARLKAFVKTCI